MGNPLISAISIIQNRELGNPTIVKEFVSFGPEEKKNDNQNPCGNTHLVLAM